MSRGVITVVDPDGFSDPTVQVQTFPTSPFIDVIPVSSRSGCYSVGLLLGFLLLHLPGTRLHVLAMLTSLREKMELT